MKIKLVIADNDDRFVVNLEEYIMRNYNHEFEIRSFTDKSYLEKFFSKVQNVDILLLNPKFQFEELENQYIKKIVLIEDYENEDAEYHSLFRYGEIVSIYHKLKDLIYDESKSSKQGRERLALNDTKVITIYSPIGGCGKSTISMAIASETASRGHKVLYLNLEDIPTMNTYFEKNKNSRNLSDISSYLSCGSDKLINQITKCINTDNYNKVKYINPADNIFDLEQMVPDDIKYLIQTLKDMNKFTHIIIDTSSTYNTFKKSIIDISNKVIIPMEQSSICKEKIRNLLRYIDEEELEKFIPIVNKYKEENKDFISDLLIENPSFQIKERIVFYSSLKDTDHYVDIFNKHNSFTASIKSLLNW